MSLQQHVTVGYRGGKSFSCRSGSGHDVVLDADVQHGGLQRGVQPAELLLMALAGSVATDVVAELEGAGQTVSSYRVEASGASDTEQAFSHIKLEHIVTGGAVSAEALERAVAEARTASGSIHAFLSGVADVTHTCRVETAPNQAASPGTGAGAKPQDWFR